MAKEKLKKAAQHKQTANSKPKKQSRLLEMLAKLVK